MGYFRLRHDGRRGFDIDRDRIVQERNAREPGRCRVRKYPTHSQPEQGGPKSLEGRTRSSPCGVVSPTGPSGKSRLRVWSERRRCLGCLFAFATRPHPVRALKTSYLQTMQLTTTASTHTIEYITLQIKI